MANQVLTQEDVINFSNMTPEQQAAMMQALTPEQQATMVQALQ